MRSGINFGLDLTVWERAIVAKQALDFEFRRSKRQKP